MKRKVLLVDDEKSFTSLLKMNLEQTGRYEVRAENWAEDALKAAKEFQPDIVLLDIIMPHLPGGNVVAQFKADPQLKDVPIIFLTAAIARSTVALHDGIICDRPCLAKPASLDEIVDAIEKNLAPASAQPEVK